MMFSILQRGAKTNTYRLLNPGFPLSFLGCDEGGKCRVISLMFLRLVMSLVFFLDNAGYSCPIIVSLLIQRASWMYP